MTKIMIDGVDYAPHTALPVKWNALLDERLDEGRLSIRHINVKRIRIGATVDIAVGDTSQGFIVSADESTEVPVGSGFYDHELSLIEPTKELEGIVVETLSFTNSLGRSYASNPIKVEPVYE